MLEKHLKTLAWDDARFPLVQMSYGAVCTCVNYIDSVCMGSIFVAYIDAYFVYFKILALTYG